ncbi:hypothetical protein SDC9_136107 [bioreactor metagenome]|uniref:Uncharacterized protein n=1 Tax=bioreactor metagenome TaxID=1076179 RepID=A0A645DI73_9ZZZZ
MDGPGHHLLARSGGAKQQNIGFMSGDAADHCVHLLPRTARADIVHHRRLLTPQSRVLVLLCLTVRLVEHQNIVNHAVLKPDGPAAQELQLHGLSVLGALEGYGPHLSAHGVLLEEGKKLLAVFQVFAQRLPGIGVAFILAHNLLTRPVGRQHHTVLIRNEDRPISQPQNGVEKGGRG